MNTDKKPTKSTGETPALRGAPARLPQQRLRPADNHLYFDAVARHGSIRKAADSLHIASSALNRRILDLEEEVGTALFERLPRGVRLTSAGELLLSYVRSSIKELRKVEAQIDQLQGQMRGVVRIAVAESVTPSLLPLSIDRYQKSHSGVGFHVMVDGPELLLDALVKDHVDMILTHDPPERSNVSVLAITEHPLTALVVPYHPLTRLATVRLSDCVSYPLAMPDHTLVARGVLDSALEEAGLSVWPALESNSIETLKAFSRLGEAVCFSFCLGPEPETTRLVALELADPRCAEARLYLAARRGRVLPVAAAAFAESLRESLEVWTLRSPVSVA